jgi:hypothetical protein
VWLVPDDRSAAADELAALRAANARLRAVTEAKDTEIAALEAGQTRQAEVIRRLELRIAELERRAGTWPCCLGHGEPRCRDTSASATT